MDRGHRNKGNGWLHCEHAFGFDQAAKTTTKVPATRPEAIHELMSPPHPSAGMLACPAHGSYRSNSAPGSSV